MLQGLGDRHMTQPAERRSQEQPRNGQNKLVNLIAAVSLEALKNRAVLTIHREEPCVCFLTSFTKISQPLPTLLYWQALPLYPLGLLGVSARVQRHRQLPLARRPPRGLWKCSSRHSHPNKSPYVFAPSSLRRRGTSFSFLMATHRGENSLICAASSFKFSPATMPTILKRSGIGALDQGIDPYRTG